MFKLFSIRTKLLCTFGPLLVVACVTLAVVATNYARRALTHTSGDALVQMATQGANLVTANVNHHHTVLEGIAGRNVIRSMDWKLQKPGLEQEIKRVGYLAMAVVSADRKARYIDETTADLSGRDYIDHAFAGQTTMSDVIISKVTNTAVMMVAAPIKDDAGKVAAVLIARLPATILNEVIDNIRFGEGGYAYIIDRKGALIVHDNKDFVLQQRNFVEEAKTKPEFVELAAMMQRMMKGDKGFEQYPFMGKHRFFGYAPIPGTNGWSIAAGALRDSVLASESQLIMLVSGVTVVIVIGGFILVWFIAGTITKPIRKVVDMLMDIAQGEGDLTKRLEVRSQDEVGEMSKWFNTFLEKLHTLISDVAMVSREVASAATEIAASSEQMATGMSEQTQQVSQISSAIEEMSASVVEVARKSAEAANHAADSGKTAEEGGTVVKQTISGMQGIHQAVSASATSVQELGKRGQQIGQIIQVINDIADQTNLLALNAAIEAARAGEHGRGFAVVADEVRKLADRTTKATEEIGGSIQAIQTETGQAVERMNAGTQQVTTGVELATQAGVSLQQIVDKAKGVADMIRSIAAAAEEQSAAGEQVSRNVESISAVTRQATEGANQAATAASQLSSRAEQLQSLVNRFKLDHNQKTAA